VFTSRCKKSSIATLLALGCLLDATAARAQEIEPRQYANAPAGINFLIASYAYTDGGISFDPSLPLTKPSLETNSAVFAYVRTLDIRGSSGKIDAVLPYTWLSGSAEYEGERVDRVVNGPADPLFRLSWNFLGAPALSVKEFASFRQDLIVGAALQVSLPLGQYDDDRLVNLGSNRWMFKPSLGVSQALGPWTLEATAAAAFFTDNEDFYGGRTRSQDPLYSMQWHVIYTFRWGAWAALDGTYYTGGTTTIDGIDKKDLKRNWRAGATLAVPINVRNSVKLYASDGVAARTGDSFTLYGIAWQYRSGGGL